MFRSIALKPAIFAAVCITASCFTPLAAHATTTASATPNQITASAFTGLTYPDTSAGLSACDTEGASLLTFPYGAVYGYNCELGNPDAGVYNLWLFYFKKSGGN
jgi:hypothetical protein